MRTGGAAFCITDCHMQHGHLPVVPPAILGHSAVGVVEQAGARVERVRVGERVIIPATPECGRCYFCLRHRSDQCVRLVGAPPRFVGTLADGSEVRAGGTATYAEQIKVPEIFAFGVDSDLPDEQLALMGCGVVSGLGAVMRVAEVEPGSSVVVVGTGHLGLWMIQGARVAGAAQIIAVEPLPERRALAGELGATDLVDPADGDPIEQVRSLTGGRGADYALEAAGRIDAMEQAFQMARNAGTVVYTGVETMALDDHLPRGAARAARADGALVPERQHLDEPRHPALRADDRAGPRRPPAGDQPDVHARRDQRGRAGLRRSVVTSPESCCRTRSPAPRLCDIVRQCDLGGGRSGPSRSRAGPDAGGDDRPRRRAARPADRGGAPG